MRKGAGGEDDDRLDAHPGTAIFMVTALPFIAADLPLVAYLTLVDMMIL